MSERPKLTLAQIVEQFEVSRATLRRGIESGRFPHAEKDTQGRWVVPVDDLIAAQVKGRKTWLNEGTHERAHEGSHPAHDEHAQGAHIPPDPTVSEVASELAHLKNELAHERAHREAAERIAEERQKHIETLNTALRMLESAPRPQPDPAVISNSKNGEKSIRRRWWQRRA